MGIRTRLGRLVVLGSGGECILCHGLSTALLHSAIVSEQPGHAKELDHIFAIIAFAMSLLGTSLVRSGVLTSVHAFASDPLAECSFVVARRHNWRAFALFAWRGRPSGGQDFFSQFREAGFFNNFLLTVAAASILLGTLYPLFLDVLNLGKTRGCAIFQQRICTVDGANDPGDGFAPFLHWKRGMPAVSPN